MPETPERLVWRTWDPPCIRTTVRRLDQRKRQRAAGSLTCSSRGLAGELNSCTVDERIRRICNHRIPRVQPRDYLDRVAVVLSDRNWRQLHVAVADDGGS